MKKRIVEVLRDGVWVCVGMSEVKKGDKFRMYERNKDPVYGEGDLAGKTEFTAGSDAYDLGNGVFGVKGVI